ncbi:hypothetical protein BTN49_1501 [Candidatus Enterovibrio escicola]|uniref:Transposase IS30-like HTH domain-containing protein n=1 Tax=Candidatus Enterovibrio escicola TaxID=1927127 RepID=A0A2A5T457_9GAMM|nr:hypothetical protein BTN49_1501 [Candidatus Enterovibrio escacola]
MHSYIQLNDESQFYIEQRLVEGDYFSQIAKIFNCTHFTIRLKIK